MTGQPLRTLLATHFYDWRLGTCSCGWRPADRDYYAAEHLEHLAQALEGAAALGRETVGGSR